MPPPAPGFVEAVDAFLAAPKRLIGAEAPLAWQSGRHPDELVVKLPLEIGDEFHGQTLMVSSFPTYPKLFFRIAVIFEPAVCRLDFEPDGLHGNNHSDPLEKLPPLIRGPHYHTWPLNRRFVKSTRELLKLPNALPLAPNIRQFDAALRFFCADNNIELPPSHTIFLPEKALLL